MTPDPIAQRLRCVKGWQPGVWVGAMRRVFGPVSELLSAEDMPPEAGDAKALQRHQTIEQHPAHQLIVLWRPQSLQRPFLSRWPLLVQLTPQQDEHAVGELLSHLPQEARLWVSDHEVDWALMAEIVMLSESALAPWQHRELAQFIQRERAATATSITAHYVGQQEAPEAGPLSDFAISLPMTGY
jgi:hypothetical protein